MQLKSHWTETAAIARNSGWNTPDITIHRVGDEPFTELARKSG
jgi:hypothetical protein